MSAGEWWLAGFLGVVLAALAAVVLATGAADCPRGQQLVQVSSILVGNGQGGFTSIPVYACQ